jgi:hypothetical protein
VEECGPCRVFASFTLEFALQLRKNHGKTTIRVRKTSVRVIKSSVRVRKTPVRIRKTSVRHTFRKIVVYKLAWKEENESS